MKKQWNILKHRAGSRKHHLFSLILALGSLILALGIFASCAPKYAERPSREGLSFSELLAKMNNIKSIQAVLSIDYEKNDATMTGDAFLNLSGNALDLRIYYLGFLAGEVKEDNGVIRSKPKLDKYKSVVLADGLKNSFMWWTITDYTIQETQDTYVLRNFNRTLIIDKKELLPLQQTIELDNGEELTISYDAPLQIKPETGQKIPDREIAWYQSRLSIHYRNQEVRVKVKSYSASTEKTADAH